MNVLRKLIHGLLITALVGLLAACSKTPTGWWTSSKKITSYGFVQPNVTGTINGTNINVTVPNGTNVTHLVADFSYDGSSIKVGSTPQISGTTPNDFTNPVTYVIKAQDGSKQDFTVTVTIAPPLSSAKDFTNYGFLNPATAGTILGTNITVTPPWYTNPDSLVAFFSTTGVSVKVGSIYQVSGKTVNNFTKPIIYTVTAQDSSTKNYIVSVTPGDIHWTNQSSAGTRNWQSITSSSDGKYLAAVVSVGSGGNIWTSNDYGATWTDRSSAGARYWISITSSSDGSHLAAVAGDGDIWTSNDYGATWTDRSSAGSRGWQSITSSADGSHLAAVTTHGDIWTSSNYGATWIDRSNAGSRIWYSITSSADGSHLAAVVGGPSITSGNIWTSNDYGATWTERSNAGSRDWYSITSSADGSHLAATANNGDIWASTDYGVTWTDLSNAGTRYWASITSSADGSHLAAVVISGDIWTSNNGGATWTDRSNAGSRAWWSIASSADGSHLAVASGGVISGDIWTGK